MFQPPLFVPSTATSAHDKNDTCAIGFTLWSKHIHDECHTVFVAVDHVLLVVMLYGVILRDERFLERIFV